MPPEYKRACPFYYGALSSEYADPREKYRIRTRSHGNPRGYTGPAGLGAWECLATTHRHALTKFLENRELCGVLDVAVENARTKVLETFKVTPPAPAKPTIEGI